MNNAELTLGIVGAVTGGVALLWNMYRGLRERARLHVTFYVRTIKEGEETTALLAMVEIMNYGTLPAYIKAVDTSDHVPWPRAWPILRSIPIRTRFRWAFRFLMWPHYYASEARFTEALPARIEAGEACERQLDIDRTKVEQYIRRRQWLVVETPLKQYPVRIFGPSD